MIERFPYVFTGNPLNLSKRYKLGDDPMCGLTTGGMKDCFWECEVTPTDDGPFITNPECLLNCFPKVKANTEQT